MSNVLVAYFSASGTTAEVAKRLAKTIHADIFEIRPRVAYTKEDLNWTDRASRSSVEMRDPACRPPLAKAVPNISGYQVIFVGFPVWWYREPSIIDTFLEGADFSTKTLIPFVTSGGSELGASASNMQTLVPQAVVKEGRRFDKNVSEVTLFEWAQKYL